MTSVILLHCKHRSIKRTTQIIFYLRLVLVIETDESIYLFTIHPLRAHERSLLQLLEIRICFPIVLSLRENLTFTVRWIIVEGH